MIAAFVPCAAGMCAPLPDWMVPWVVAGSFVLFLVTLIWAIWTIRRR